MNENPGMICRFACKRSDRKSTYVAVAGRYVYLSNSPGVSGGLYVEIHLNTEAQMLKIARLIGIIFY